MLNLKNIFIDNYFDQEISITTIKALIMEFDECLSEFQAIILNL